MRALLTMALCAGFAATAAAQTEIIIRRPGQKDQVIRLDSTRMDIMRSRLDTVIRLETRAMADMQKRIRPLIDTISVRAAPMTRSLDDAIRNRIELIQKGMEGVRQPHLGVWVDTRVRDSDKYGAYVTAVTPGSPAQKAGIVAGDIITKIAGQSLTGSKSDNPDESGPGMRLITIVAKLDAGKPVDVELRRGDATKTVRVTPVEDGSVALALRAPSPMTLEGMARAVPGGIIALPQADRGGFSYFADNGPGGAYYSFSTDNLFANLELAPMNEKLGSYFGTSEGVLVVNVMQPERVAFGRMQGDSVAPKVAMSDSARAGGFGGVMMRKAEPVDLGLQPGDVIVSVDGRKVTSPGQLMRIVATYDRGDQFKLQIMRQKRAESIDVKMP